MQKIKNYKKWNITALLKCYSRAPKFNNCPRNAWIVIIFGMWYVFRVLIRQLYVKGHLVANEIWWNIYGWGEDRCIKSGRGCKQKGNNYIIFSQIVKATCAYCKWKINIPIFNCIICQIYLFNTVIISSTLFSAYSNRVLTFICRRVPQRKMRKCSSCRYL